MPLIGNTNRAIYEIVQRASYGPEKKIDFLFGDFDHAVLHAERPSNSSMVLSMYLHVLDGLDKESIFESLQNAWKTELKKLKPKKGYNFSFSFYPTQVAAAEISNVIREIFAASFSRALSLKEKQTLHYNTRESLSIDPSNDKLACTITISVQEQDAVLMKLFLTELSDHKRQAGWAMTTFEMKEEKKDRVLFSITFTLFSRCYEDETRRKKAFDAIIGFKATAKCHIQHLKTLMNVKMRSETTQYIKLLTCD
eukprot:GHVN01070020.1.p1 GENE.GHVN01070020.1~~GHVN01070020.1.p1  ORF type:complete len:253 (+),score=26.23 GHVN01070020.1:248-1006(+)